MSHLSDYQQSALALLDIPQWQLRAPDQVSIELDTKSLKADSTEDQEISVLDELQSEKLKVEREALQSKVPIEKVPEVSVPEEKMREIIIIDEVILVGGTLSLTEDIRIALQQFEIPLNIVDDYVSSNQRFRLAIIPETLNDEVGKEELRYSASLSVAQKKHLWTLIKNWQ